MKNTHPRANQHRQPDAEAHASATQPDRSAAQLADQHATSQPRTRWGSSAALWASAFVLLGMIVHSASNQPASSALASDANTTAGRLAIATALSSGGEDMIVVIDNASEKLLMYTVTSGRGLELKQSRNIEELFPDRDDADN